MSTERKPTESFADYQARRKAENSTERTYLRGRVVHQSIFPSVNKETGKLEMYSQTYRAPVNLAKLDKWQRRKLRKLAAKITAKEKTA
jgi:hypothetical protein